MPPLLLGDQAASEKPTCELKLSFALGDLRVVGGESIDRIFVREYGKRRAIPKSHRRPSPNHAGECGEHLHSGRPKRAVLRRSTPARAVSSRRIRLS